MALPLRYNLRSLSRRKTRATMTALGIGLAVLVSVLMLALSTGLMNSIRATGHPLNVLVTSKGAETTEFSAIDPAVLDVLRFSPYVAVENGHPLASPEIYFTTQVETAPGARPAQALVRGVLPTALSVHDQVRLSAGRSPDQPGEIMVGPLVAVNLGVPEERLAIGQSLMFEGTPWKIVGRFVAPGTAFESEVWGPLDDLMVATRRSELSSVVLRAKDTAAMEEMLFDFATRTDVLVEVRKETAYYAAYAEAFRPVQLMVYVMTGMLILGGVFIGANTLFAALMSRIREIGVLRTVGYRRSDIALAFLIESLIPAIIGGVLACVIALCANGFALRIPMGAFRFEVGPSLLGAGLGLSVLIGIFGAAWPLCRSARLKTVDAIRHL
ncbi:MAG: ABC transporter permease [Terrimicrobiaceae bacterium]|nr:ABC transporter permease [Terrimicrobiaceae bacterium]